MGNLFKAVEHADVCKNVAELMNACGQKAFNRYQVSAIRSAIQLEFHDRKAKNLTIRSRTMAGKSMINKRIADIDNDKLDPSLSVTTDDVKLCKKCICDEYSQRTGKCSWGFKDVRSRMGYDPDTALEL